MTTDSFSKIEEGSSTTNKPSDQPYVDLENLIPTIEEKRQIIKYLLRHNFPIRPFLFYCFTFILIGIAAILLETVLIIDQTVNYKIANGIWAGFFSIVNGVSKLLLLKTRSYRAHVISQVVTPYQGLTVSIGLTFLSTYNLRRYECDSTTDKRCMPPNREVTICMLILGVFSLIMNITFIFMFFKRLHGNWVKARSQRLSFFEAYREICYVFNCTRKI